MGNHVDKMSLSKKLVIDSEGEKSTDNHAMLPGTYKVIAKCNYKANGKVNDISFRKNETMYVIWKFNDSWLEVVKENGQQHGLVPSRLVIKLAESPQNVEGWLDVVRLQAKYLLLNPDLRRGTYILRPSSRKNCYALSVRDYDKKKNSYIVKNFLIKTIQTEKGEEYLTHVRVYPNILMLINYFKIHGIGVNHTKLTEPIPEYCQSIPDIRQPIPYFCNQFNNNDNDNFDFCKCKISQKISEEKIEKQDLERNNFVAFFKFKIKYQCHKISNCFEKCTKPDYDN